MNEQSPLPVAAACAAWSAASSPPQCSWPGGGSTCRGSTWGWKLGFADGTSARVYRETVVDGGPRRPIPARSWWSSGCGPCEAGAMPSSAGRACSTPRCSSASPASSPSCGWPTTNRRLPGRLRVGRGDRAEAYARALWRVLALVSVPGSIHYGVVPGVRRSDLLAHPRAARTGGAAEPTDWWRLVEVA